MNEPPRRGMAFILPLVLMFLVIAALAAGAVYLFFNLTGGGGRSNVPVITSPESGAPAKVKPAQPAEIKPAPLPEKPRRKLIYDRIIPDDAKKPGSSTESKGAAPPLPPPLPPPPSLGPEQGNKQPTEPVQETANEERAASMDGLPLPPVPSGTPSAEADKTETTSTTQPPATAASSTPQTGNGIALPPPVTMDNDKVTATGDVSDDTTVANGAPNKKAKANDTETAVADPQRTDSGAQPQRVAAKKTVTEKKRGAPQSIGQPAPKPVAKKAVNATRKEARPARNIRAARRAAPRPKPRPAVAKAAPRRPAKTTRRPTAPIVLPGVAAITSSPPTIARPATNTRANTPVRAFAPPATPLTPRKRTNFGHARNTAPAQRPPTRVASITPPARAITRSPTTRAQSLKSGGYVVQLAAFRSQQDALRAWQRVRARHGRLLGGLQPIVNKKDLGSAGTFYRLSVGPLPSRQAASRLCQRLIAGGEPDCLIRKR